MVSISCLWCDDIRTEDTFKSILVGVYTGDVVVPSFPFSTWAWLHFTINGAPPGEHVLHSQIRFDDGTAMSDINRTPFPVFGRASAQLKFFDVPLDFQKSGWVEVHAALNSDDMDLISCIYVKDREEAERHLG